MTYMERAIKDLYKDGKTIVEIAEILQMPASEVEIILKEEPDGRSS